MLSQYFPRTGSTVISYTATTCFVYPSLSSCARAFGVSRQRIVELIITGATHSDGITTFDIPMDSDINLDAYNIKEEEC